MSNKGWMVTFPKESLRYTKLLDAFVLDANMPLFIDSVNFPDAIAISGTRELPPTLERMGLRVLNGTIPEQHERPAFDPQVVWLRQDDGSEPLQSCLGTKHIGPWERISHDGMERCTACGATIGK